MEVCDMCGIMEPDYFCKCHDYLGGGFVLCEDCYKSNPEIVAEHDWND